jgi:protease stability complex PrcB-like protein
VARWPGFATIAGGLFTAGLTLSACAHPTAPSTPLTLTRFRPEPSSYLAFSGYDQPQTIAIHDRDTWVRTWSEINRRADPPPPIPEVDFASEMVLVAALGSRPSSGYEIVFTGASEAGDVVTIEVESRSPGPRCVTLTVVTSPIDLARIPRRNGAIVFRTAQSVVNCP